jgi:hypothetical protein
VCSGVRVAACGVRGHHWRGQWMRFWAGSLHLCNGGRKPGVVGCAACVVVGIGVTVGGDWGSGRVLGAKLVCWEWVEVVGCWVSQL